MCSVNDPMEALPDAVDGRVESTARQLAPLLLEQMRRHAKRERRRFRASETLCTTALVHEAYLKLYRTEGWQDETHFLRAAALAMRQALVDHARMKLTAKRGGPDAIIPLDDAIDAEEGPFWISDERLVALEEALVELSRLNPRLTHVVECRFFGGYSDEDTARILGVTDRTVRRDWLKARAWLFDRLEGRA